MRDAFVRALTELARVDRNLLLLTADLGFGVLTGFAQEFPRQFLNVGVAEQNLTGVATGLALEGKTVFTYSIGNFHTLRCLEHIRNDVCYHQANVKIVSIGGGFCYGPLGVSHHATEDLAIMRALPHLTVVAPGDVTEAFLATRAVYGRPGPCYLRLGRGGEPTIHPGEPDFILGKAIPLFVEGEVALLSTGGILASVVAAQELLQERNIPVRVYSVHSLKPLDQELINELADQARLLVTVEEHHITGGLGGAVAEVLAELARPRAPLIRLGLRGGFSSEVGDQDYLREIYGLSPQAIARQVQEALRKPEVTA
jgi:transketolase